MRNRSQVMQLPVSDPMIPVVYLRCSDCEKVSDVVVGAWDTYKRMSDVSLKDRCCPRCGGKNIHWWDMRVPKRAQGCIMIVDEREEK